MVAPQIYAQTKIYGKITDSKTNEPLPFVNVAIVGTALGTSSNLDGEYLITVSEKATQINFSSIGYESQTISFTYGQSNQINVQLKNSEVVVSDVVVYAKKRERIIDTPAVTLYRAVVAAKPINKPDNINSYSYNSYVKMQMDFINLPEKWVKGKFFKPFDFVFENGDTASNGKHYVPAFIHETVSDYYYRKSPKASKEILRGSQLSGIENESVGELGNFQFDDVDAYDNLIILAGKSFLSPFSPTALSTYLYFLPDSQLIDGRKMYKLQFTAKNKEDVAFIGHAWIDSATKAIASIEMGPNVNTNINFLSDYRIRQDYKINEDNIWLMTQEIQQTEATAFNRSKKDRLSARITKTSSRKDIQTNIDFPDDFFSGDNLERVENVYDRSDSFWVHNRHDTLTHEEKQIYTIVDSIKNTPRFKNLYWFGYLMTSGYARIGPVDVGRVYKMFSRNSIEGYRFRFGWRTNEKLTEKFQLQNYVAYGLKDKDWKYDVEMKFLLPSANKRLHQIETRYQYDLRILGSDNPLITHDNMIVLLRSTPLSYMMKVRELEVNYQREFVQDFTATFGYLQSRYYAIPGQLDFLTPSEKGYIKSESSVKTAELYFEGRYAYKQKFYENEFNRKYLQTAYPVLEFSYALGIEGLANSEFNYHRVKLNLKQRLSWPAGYTKYQISAGKIWGKTPYPAQFLTAGNVTFIYDKFNYNLLREFEFISDQYVSLWLDHHFEGFFFNKIPGFNKLKLREVITFKGLIGNQANDKAFMNPDNLSTPYPVPYIEVGFGIENILNMGRIDFLWRATHRNVPGGANFGIRIGFIPTF